MPPTPEQVSEALCLECGLCCDGTLFQDVRLLPGEAVGPLKARGMPVKTRGRKRCLDQPCTALRGLRCEIYAIRPGHCRGFECLLFQSARRGEIAIPSARSRIRTTLRQLERIKRLFQRLEDRHDDLALRRRFRDLARRMEASPLNAAQAQRFSELTLAFHKLNLRLQRYFLDE